MATFIEQLDAVIGTLSAAKEDAAKVDLGKTGVQGTRLRKAATDATKALAVLKKSVTVLRKGNAAATERTA